MPESHRDTEDQRLQQRLEALKASIGKQTPPDPPAGSGSSGDTAGAKGMAAGFRVMSELVSTVIVGAAIGWGLDRLTGLSPLFLIAFVVLGFGAGFRNVYRLGMGKRPPAP
jgi:ATP synthase protein I